MMARCARCHAFKDVGVPCVVCYPHSNIGGPQINQPPVKETWPWIVRTVYARRIDGERGIGDTVERLFAYMGGRQFKAFMKANKTPCGCSDRQAWLNARYPY